MSLEVITMWRKEDKIAPFFLNHYKWADRISIFFSETGPDDPTYDILKRYSNVNLIPFRFPNDKLDDDIKIAVINDLYRKTECDFVLAVDADEFVFYKSGSYFIYDLRGLLDAQPQYDLYFSSLRNVYRHSSDTDLDPSLPPIPQRRHGDPNMFRGLRSLYNKPIVARRGLDLAWTPGCHNLTRYVTDYRLAPDPLLGAHWILADPSFAVSRNAGKTAQLSENNLQKGYLFYLKDKVTDFAEKDILDELASHQNDPQVF